MSSSDPIRLAESNELFTAPSATEKTAFVQAMYRGVEPDSEAARAVARKKGAEATPKVEILNRIPAPSSLKPAEAPANALSASALALAADIEAAMAADDPGRITPEAQQALIAALGRVYAANDDNGNHFAIVDQGAITATDVMVLCSALLRAVDLQVFELSVWQSWSSR